MAVDDDLDWNDLRYFLRAAQSGTLAGAARAMGVDHSTVGRRLSALERALGAPVVLRAPDGLHLTPLGESLMPLAEDVDTSRGDMITGIDDAPSPRTQLEATICWMSQKPMKNGAKYRLRHTTRLVKAMVSGIQHKVDPNTLEKLSSPTELQQNDIARISLKTLLPIACDSYRENRETGAFLLIDDNNDTAGAGFIE